MSSDTEARITAAIPPLDSDARERAAAQDLELCLLDPTDPDERSLLIRLAHPELDDAMERGENELMVDGRPMNPRLHLAIHEVVATQVIDGEPPEVFETAERLVADGRDPHEVLHMLGSTVTDQIWAVTNDQRPYDRAEHVAALAALPGRWDERAAPPRAGERHHRHRGRR